MYRFAFIAAIIGSQWLLPSASAAVAFVQGKTTNLTTFNGTTLTLTFAANTAAGNLIAGQVWWNGTKTSLNSVTGCGNTYVLVLNPTSGGSSRSAGFYAKNINGGACSVTANFSAKPGSAAITMHEVSGVDRTGPLVGSALQYQALPGTGTNAVTSGSATTTSNGDYVFGATVAANAGAVSAPGTGFAGRILGTNHGIRSEDLIQGAAGPLAATFTASATSGGNWTLLMAFKPDTTDNIPPSVPTGLSAAALSISQINLTWVASTDNFGVTGYKVFRGGVQVGTSAGASYADQNLASATTYTYTVSAYDAAGNNSAVSSPVSATTLTPFTFNLSNAGNIAVVRGLSVANTVTANLATGTPLGVNFTVAGLPSGATAAFSLASCVPACTTNVTIATNNTTPLGSSTITITGTSGSQVKTTQFSLTVNADTTAPSIPAGLSATAVSVSQINLGWSASTDNVGVTGYKVFRNGAPVGTTAALFYSDQNLTAGTTYSYTVSAFDAASNNSAPSTAASATTFAPFTFTLSNSGNVQVIPSLSVTNTISAALVSGTAASVAYSAAGLPAGATASFSAANCIPTCTTLMTIATTASTPLGTSAITVKGTSGTIVNTTQFGLTVTADSTPPAVSVTAPGAGTQVAGTVTVSATASDNIAVGAVQFLLDGVALGAKQTAAPYSVSWDTTKSANGLHTLSAAATDTSNNTATSATVPVTVANTLPTLTLQLSGTGLGTVVGGGINCGAVCSAAVAPGTVVTMTATAANTSTFSGWGGACAGTVSTCTLTINSNTLVTAGFTLQTSGAVPKLTDFVDMSTGADGALLSPAIATADTSPASGASGIWNNGPAGAPVQLFVSQTSGIAPPPLGPVQVGQVAIADTHSPGMYRKHATQEYDLLSYDFNAPPAKASLGMYMQFTGPGWGTTAWGSYYDVLVGQATDGNFVSFNMIAEAPLIFQIETEGCTNAVPIVSGNINQWYWVTMYWDTPNLIGTVKIYDPASWILLGSASCAITNSTLSSVWIGDSSVHGNPPIDGDFYIKDLMIDAAGVYNASNPLIPAAGQGKIVVDTFPPSMPANLTGVQNGPGILDLSWTASVDNIAVASYRVLRCQGPGCTPTLEVGRWTAPFFEDTGLTAATTYVYAVSALDGSGNESSVSTPFAITLP